jgi:hypothetical protein
MLNQISRQYPGDFLDPMAMVSSAHPNMMTFKLNKHASVSTPPPMTWSPKPPETIIRVREFVVLHPDISSEGNTSSPAVFTTT